MTLIQLEYFIKVAEELNFTKAAERLFVSQQGISRQIKLLEQEFGFPLFVRTTRSVSLTGNGKKLYELLEKHRKEFHNLISDAMLSEAKQQTIRLGIIDASRIVDMIVPVIERLEQEYPHIIWEYQTGNFSELQDRIDCSELDMIVTLSTELPKTHPQDQILILRFLELSLFVSDRHPLSDQDNLTVEALNGETLLTYTSDFSYHASSFVLEDCRQKGIRPAEIKYYSNFNSIEMALLAGKGISIGFNIFYRDPLHRIREYPIEAAEGLTKANLVMVWTRPEYKVFAKIFEEFL